MTRSTEFGACDLLVTIFDNLCLKPLSTALTSIMEKKSNAIFEALL